jgi:DNA-binding response OmpR family regulator
MEKPLNILLIEDNPGDAFLIKFYLEESVFKNARLIHAEFMRTALDLLSKNAFDVILLDLNLPDSKGIETLQEILDIVTDSVVIVLTGLSDEELGVQTVKMGAQDFLIKGQFDGKVLTSSVRYAFERYQLQKKVDTFTNKLDENKQQLDAIQDLGHLGYWELNLNDQSMQWTTKLHQLLGVAADETPRNLNSLLKMVNKEDAEQLHECFLRAIEQGAPFTCAITLDSKNGQKYVCRSQPLYNNEKVITKIGGIIQEA